jgi:hypothetical protein
MTEEEEIFALSGKLFGIVGRALFTNFSLEDVPLTMRGRKRDAMGR